MVFCRRKGKLCHDGRKNSAAKIAANNRYDKKTYFRVLVRFHKEDENRIRAAAGDSLNGFIVSAVLEKVERETGRQEPEQDHTPEAEE